MSEDPTKETNDQELTPAQLDEVAGGLLEVIAVSHEIKADPHKPQSPGFNILLENIP